MDRLKEFFALNKFERLELMREFGLNTPEYVHFPRKHAETFGIWARDSGLSKNQKVSVRFFSRDEDLSLGSQPHLPNVGWETAWLKILSVINSYDIMITTVPVDPHFTIVCGNLQMELHSIDGYGIAIFEYRWGAGTVRRVAKWCEHLECNLHEYPQDEHGVFCQGLARAKAAALKFPYWNKVIFEWSFYSYEVGWKKDQLIFWEVRHR